MVAFLQPQKLHFFTKKLSITIWANQTNMSIKSFAAKIFAKRIHQKTQKWATNPIETQQKVFLDLIQQALKLILEKTIIFHK